MAEFQRLGDLLGGLTIRDEDGGEHPIVPIGDAPSPAMLLDPRITPPRSVLDARLAVVQGQLGKEWLAAPQREFYTREATRLERLLTWNDLKDAMQATRPPGCWCLGAGYRTLLPHEATVAYRPDVLTLEETTYPIFTSGDAVAYCDCPAGAVVRQAHAAGRAARDQSIREARLKMLWQTSGIPGEANVLDGRTWLREIQGRDPTWLERGREILRTLSAWLDGDEWLWLEGPLGRGKTVLLWIACRRLAEQQGKHVMYFSFARLLEDIRLAYDEEGVKVAPLLRMLSAVDILALDDVGKERPTPWVAERLYVLVNDRYVQGKRTLFTSNLSLRGGPIREHLDPSVVARIAQRCGANGVVALAGPNLRDTPD